MMQLEAYSQRIYSKENSKDDKLKQNSFCNCIFLTALHPFLVSMEIMIFFLFFFFTKTNCSNLNLTPTQGSLVDKAARAHRQELGLNQLQVIT